MSYDGPVIDAFLHSPWFGEDDPITPRGDRADWTGDRRLRRVMHTFHHPTDEGEGVTGVSAESLLAEMAAAGVVAGVLAAKVYYAASVEAVESTHRQIAAVCAKAPGKLLGAASAIPPELGPGTYWDVLQSSRVLADAHREHGFIGVHITPSPWGMAPNHKWFYPLYAKCVELDLTVFAYVGMPGPLWPMEPNNPSHLDEIALAFPDLKIIAHHIGDPWVDIAVRLAARHDNVYICTSAWSPKRYPQPLLDFMAGKWHGTDGYRKVIFASDHPLLAMDRTVRDARQLPLANEQLEGILYANARSLFWKEHLI